jgi:DNA-binding NarL/FixJ family response regulator
VNEEVHIAVHALPTRCAAIVLGDRYPDGSGIDLLRAQAAGVHLFGEGTKKILYTGDQSPETAAIYQSLGVDTIMYKPDSIHQVTKNLEHLIIEGEAEAKHGK